MARLIFGTLVTFAGVALLGFGAYLVYEQEQIQTNAQQVDVEITSSEVRTSNYTSKGRKRTSYRPEISFRYRVSGVWYNGKDVYATGNDPSGSPTSYDIVRQYPAGTMARGFYDKRQPARGFLRKRYSFEPYLLPLIGGVVLVVGRLVLAGGGRRPASLTTGGRWELHSGRSIAYKSNVAITIACSLLVVGLATFGHFYGEGDPTHRTFSIVVLCIYGALTAVAIGAAAYCFRLRLSMSDAIVTVDRHPLTRGQPVTVVVALPLSAGGRIDSAAVTLACIRHSKTQSGGKTQYSTHDEWTQEREFAREQDLVSDRLLTSNIEFAVPVSPPATSTDKSYPRYEWVMRVKVKRTGPDYHATFPVEVV